MASQSLWDLYLQSTIDSLPTAVGGIQTLSGLHSLLHTPGIIAGVLGYPKSSFLYGLAISSCSVPVYVIDTEMGFLSSLSSSFHPAPHVSIAEVLDVDGLYTALHFALDGLQGEPGLIIIDSITRPIRYIRDEQKRSDHLKTLSSLLLRAAREHGATVVISNHILTPPATPNAHYSYLNPQYFGPAYRGKNMHEEHDLHSLANHSRPALQRLWTTCCDAVVVVGLNSVYVRSTGGSQPVYSNIALEP